MIVIIAPWMLGGFLLSGILHVLIPTEFIHRQLRAPGLISVIKATLFGIPLPLCSCSVIPVGVALRRQGASKGATASFMISTPEIGVDSIMVSYGLLGPIMTIVRVVAVACSAFAVGWSVDKWVAPGEETSSEPRDVPDCCHGKQTQGNPAAAKSPDRLQHKLWNVLRYAYWDTANDLAVVLCFGFLSAGLVSAFLPSDYFTTLQLNSFATMLATVVVALPMYVCATSATPLVAALMAKGLAPGAALVFLLAGPATNVTTMLAVGKEIGAKGLGIYVGGLITVSMIFGAAIDHWWSHDTFALPTSMAHHEHGSAATIPAVLLTALIGIHLAVRLYRWCRRSAATSAPKFGCCDRG